MRTGLFVLLVGLAVVQAAPAEVAPRGFVVQPVLSARAAFIAGKPVRVYCTSSDTAWQAFLASVNDTLADAGGVTLQPGDSATYLSPDICGALIGRTAKKPVILGVLGASLQVLAHEGFHMRGISDEGITDCDAYRMLPKFLVARWGFRHGSRAFGQVMAGVRADRAELPAQYRTVC